MAAFLTLMPFSFVPPAGAGAVEGITGDCCWTIWCICCGNGCTGAGCITCCCTWGCTGAGAGCWGAARVCWLGGGCRSLGGLAAGGFARIGCGLARIGSRFSALIDDAKAEDGPPMPPAGGHLGSCEGGPEVLPRPEDPVSRLGTSLRGISEVGAAAGLAGSGAGAVDPPTGVEEGVVSSFASFGRSIFLLAMPFFLGAAAGSAAGAVCCCGGPPGNCGPPPPAHPWPCGGCGGGWGCPSPVWPPLVGMGPSLPTGLASWPSLGSSSLPVYGLTILYALLCDGPPPPCTMGGAPPAACGGNIACVGGMAV
mmetsp:Transcript_15947/g.42144  ORF Transcript_15947/g.42144 Transcript_15947/m.42144 type:complete len:310 (-) Transcript_15947:602-1531(-)